MVIGCSIAQGEPLQITQAYPALNVEVCIPSQEEGSPNQPPSPLATSCKA